ncbi:MAG TPA: hypothetical protein VKD00_04460, partial [Methyloceanibacter sp.]|nr:hypothetical protein [Methyloceanibacter sp.]
LIVWQAHKHGCKYDATLINCVMGKSGGEQPAAETPAPAPAPAPEAPAPAPAPEAPAPAPAPEAPAPEAPAPAQ